MNSHSIKILHKNFQQKILDKFEISSSTNSINNNPTYAEREKKSSISSSSASCSLVSSSSDCGSDSDRNKEESSGNESSSDCSQDSSHIEDRAVIENALSPYLSANVVGKLNNGRDCCKCSQKSKFVGTCHYVYEGEKLPKKCVDSDDEMGSDHGLDNKKKLLYPYFINSYPQISRNVECLTKIRHNGNIYNFSGFILLSHVALDESIPCYTPRSNFTHKLHLHHVNFPIFFSIKSLELINKYFFHYIFQFLDWSESLFTPTTSDTCPMFHFLPRFKNEQSDLELKYVLEYFYNRFTSFISPRFDTFKDFDEWHFGSIKVYKHSIVCFPGKRPSALRVDQLEFDQSSGKAKLVHFTMESREELYSHDSAYNRKKREFIRLRKLITNRAVSSQETKNKLRKVWQELNKIKKKFTGDNYRNVLFSDENCYETGIYMDVIHYVYILPVLMHHLRFILSLSNFESKIKYRFKQKNLLQEALTHVSYVTNQGTNPAHIKNSLSHCGIQCSRNNNSNITTLYKKANFGRRKGLTALTRVISNSLDGSTPKKLPLSHSKFLYNNERLEFLGDAVLELIVSINLFYIFSNHQEGNLASYRSALVSNSYLAEKAACLGIEKYMLYAHGPDLCHENDRLHAMADCIEAIVAAIFLDASFEEAKKFVAHFLFGDDPRGFEAWTDVPRHELQEAEVDGDRHWIEKSTILQDLTKLEDEIGVHFTHIRLCAKAFTRKSIAYNHLSMGHNERLEFLGDSILKFLSSLHLYQMFPMYQEGHLSIIRTCLVNAQTQCEVCNELALQRYLIDQPLEENLSTKDKADLIEAFIAALFVDKDMEFCSTFFNVLFVPKIQNFIKNGTWNNPKCLLQQCCLTLREFDKSQSALPSYKVLNVGSITNTKFKAIVYFRDERLSVGFGKNKKDAEQNAALSALKSYKNLFPVLKNKRCL